MPPVPQGGLILVTGATGYIAGSMISQLLARGYRVRGTVRSLSKSSWMPTYYGPSFSLIEVPDLGAPHAFDEAVRGVDGIAATASIVNLSTDPHTVITPAVQGVISLLEAAAKEPSVKSFVLTSSMTATCIPKPGEEYFVGRESWNDEAVKLAWEPSTDESTLRRMIVYGASKTEGERKAFQWVREHKPRFSFNSIIPPFNIGPINSPKNTGFPSTIGLLHSYFYGNDFATAIPGGQFVDVADCALLHIAALTVPGVENERLFSLGGFFSWTLVRDIFKKLYPERKFLEDVKEVVDDKAVYEPVILERATELLKALGKNGWTPLEDVVRRSCEQFVEFEGQEGLPETVMQKAVTGQVA